MATRQLLVGRPHLGKQMFAFQQATGASATSALGVADEAGYIDRVAFGSIAIATGAATLTADFKKNGTSVLSGGTPIQLDSSSTARVAKIGTLASPPIVVAPGDFFETVLVYTAGGGGAPTGVVAQLSMTQELAGLTRIPLGIAAGRGFISDARLSCLTLLTGNTTWTCDIQRTPVGGAPASILVAVMSLTATMTARQSILGAIALAQRTVEAGDYFEAVVTPIVGTGTLPQNTVFQVALDLN